MATVTGTDSGEQVIGTAGDDLINALGGDDHISGRGGHDTIDGGAGHDTVYFGATGTPVVVSRSGERIVITEAGVQSASSINVEAFAIVAGGLATAGLTVDASQVDVPISFTLHDFYANTIVGSTGDNIFARGLGLSGYAHTLTGAGGSDRYEFYTDFATMDGVTILDLDLDDTIHVMPMIEARYVGSGPLTGPGDYRSYTAGGQTFVVADGGATVLTIAGSYMLEETAPGSNVLRIFARLGTEGADTLSATGDAEYVRTLGGADTIVAGAGADTLDGGAGADSIEGGGGDDRLFSHAPDPAFPAGLGRGLSQDMSADADVLNGGAGNDHIFAGYGDTIDGGTGSDTLSLSLWGATSGVHLSTHALVSEFPYPLGGGTIVNVETLASLHGSEFADTFVVTSSGPRLTIVSGASAGDVVYTYAYGSAVDFRGSDLGNDFLSSLGDGNIFDGGAGNDTISYEGRAAGVTVTLGLLPGAAGSSSSGDQIRNVETVVGSNHGDTVHGSNEADKLYGADGNDTINGNDGNDTLSGGLGSDATSGGAGNDIHWVDNAGDQVFEAAGQGFDTVVAEASWTLAAGQHVERIEMLEGLAIALTGNELANRLIGNAVTNTLAGGAGDDVLEGRDGDDVLAGGAGLDTLEGGAGDDRYYVDNAGDVVTELTSQGTADRVFASVSYTLGAGVQVEKLTTTDNAGTSAINLTGNELAQQIYGNAGNNLLDGKGGADALVGLGGNDWYYVDNAADVVVEAAGGGSDRIFASVSYTLGAGVEVEMLGTDTAGGTAAINLTGNALANLIYGNAGNNVLDGKAGADTLTGYAGDDWYYVDNAADVVLEGGGSDRVLASVSYTLAADLQVEKLTTTDNAGTGAINLTGNERVQQIYGNAGSNVLDGRGGADTLIGLGGDDSYYVDNALDVVSEGAGGGSDRVYSTVSYALGAGVQVEKLTTTDNAGTSAINLTGNELANTIYGNAGANVLDGKGGADTLVGLAGADSFAFTTALGGGNVDTVSGFSVADDTIRLENAVFTGLAAGALAAGAFNTGAAATQADDRVIYNSATGALLFDADGAGGTAAVQFATLAAGLALTSADFLVV